MSYIILFSYKAFFPQSSMKTLVKRLKILVFVVSESVCRIGNDDFVELLPEEDDPVVGGQRMVHGCRHVVGNQPEVGVKTIIIVS